VEEEDIARMLGDYRRVLDEGAKHLSSLDFPEAIEAFARILNDYKTGKIPMVTPDARLIVAKSYEGRGLAMANLGRDADASADFEALIRFDPAYAIDLKDVSPKIVALYTKIRKKIVGVVSVEGDPLGAEVILGDQSLGLTPLTDRESIAGTYHLRVTHMGYDPYEEDVRLDAGAKLAKRYRLTPNAVSIQIATVPREVKVLVDGQERGATFGTAGAKYADAARKLKANLSDVSAPLLVEYLPPGAHTILLRKECYEDTQVGLDLKVDPNSTSPVEYEPFVLAPSRGRLEIASEPVGAQVTLDGKVLSAAPVALEDVCSGKHDLLLEKEGLGRFTGNVEVIKGETVKVTERLRLSLAAFDVRPGVKDGESLGAGLQGIEGYNLAQDKGGVPTEAAERVRLEVESSQGKGLSERTVKELLKSLKVELLGVALPVGGVGDQVEFQLYGSLSSIPDRWLLETSKLDGFRRVKFALDEKLPVEMPWSGMKLIDVYGKRHPVVLSVTPGGPAAAAGVNAGDLIVTAGVTPIEKAADFLTVLKKSTAGEEVALSVESAGKTHEMRLRLLSTPVLLPFKSATILYNKAIADEVQAPALAPDAAQRSYAWLNVGVALMHLGQWETALREAFRKVDLPDAAGISRGTARYLEAICYEKLGLSNKARTAYAEASVSATATLGSHDGPALAPIAKRRASTLPESK